MADDPNWPADETRTVTLRPDECRVFQVSGLPPGPQDTPITLTGAEWAEYISVRKAFESWQSRFAQAAAERTKQFFSEQAQAMLDRMGPA